MKKTLAIICSLLFLTGISQAWAASENSRLTMLDVLQKLNDAGYTQINEIDNENGVYQVKAYIAGQSVKLQITENDGVIPPYQKRLTALQVAEKVKAAGYSNIREVEYDNGRFEVKVYSDNGDKIKFYVDPISGNISRSHKS